jgi:hypothetical protein
LSVSLLTQFQPVFFGKRGGKREREREGLGEKRGGGERWVLVLEVRGG